MYKLAHRLSVEVHRMTIDELPKFERYEEGEQIRRSSKSVPANIVEGFGRRRYKDDFIRFLTIAHASCSETIEHLEILQHGIFKKGAV
ncbi:MAG: four helix bundle protein [Deltaproteobacteria bacterium]|nr:four helix bundle protein [Deltaproteobacteria bacterium]